jgi:predicted Zn finger-like uncharacterized protein
MNVSCPQCSTVYRVDPAKVPDGGVRARCSACGGVIPVGINPGPRRPTPVDAMADAFAQPRTSAGPFTPAQNRRTPAQPARPMTPPMSPRVTPQATPRAKTPPSPAPGLGASLPPLRPTPRAAAPAVRPTPATPAPAAAASSSAPVSVPAETPPPAPLSAAPAVLPAAGARRPINPFLARDPSLRAKRLARALVSDMVAYYPAKHAEGLEKGTLKELFRDEIKKSYEEYVAQVGADFARSTTHFQESLNEVLGAGRKIF